MFQFKAHILDQSSYALYGEVMYTKVQVTAITCYMMNRHDRRHFINRVQVCPLTVWYELQDIKSVIIL